MQACAFPLAAAPGEAGEAGHVAAQLAAPTLRSSWWRVGSFTPKTRETGSVHTTLPGTWVTRYNSPETVCM